MFLSKLAEIIIIIGGVAGAIVAVWNLLGKPVVFFKKRKQLRDDQEMDKLIARLDAHLQPKFDNLQAQLDDIKQDLILQKKSVTDMMRWMIMQIYLLNKEHKTLTTEEKIVLDELFVEYTASGGNGRIKHVYSVMEEWPVIDD